MKTINYTCKICRKPGTLEFDDSQPHGANWNDELMAKMLCHDRCMTFKTDLQRLERAVFMVSWKFRTERQNVQKEKERADLVKTVREVFRSLSQRYMAVWADYWRLENHPATDFWERMTGAMIAEPDQACSLLHQFRHELRQPSLNK